MSPHSHIKNDCANRFNLNIIIIISLCLLFPSQSVEFHERGKNHKENVAAKISEVCTYINAPAAPSYTKIKVCFYFFTTRDWEFVFKYFIMCLKRFLLQETPF